MATISVIIPAYNVNGYLQEACDSVLSQTFDDWECIIVDDGSTDGTFSVAEQYCQRDARFRTIRQENSGVATARNVGLSQACGPFVAFLDADDVLEPTAFECWVNALLAAPECVLAWGSAIRFEDKTNIVKDIPWKNYLATGCAWHDMLVHDFLPVGTFCLRRSALPVGCQFNPLLTHAEDRDFLLRVLRGNCIVSVNRQVLRFRLRGDSASSAFQAAIENELNVMQMHLADPDVPSKIRRRARSALAFRCAVVAAFTGRQYTKACGWYLKAILIDPLNINLFLLPLRKCAMALREKLRCGV